MFKKLIIGITILSMIPINVFAFDDVSDLELTRATKTLSSLGIINGVGNNLFNPTGTITRAEFAKIAVLALGDTDTSSYKNMTIFPDVPHTFWAAEYINSAVKSHQIIKGFPDGTFNPNGNINYGEALTIMLYMLDYEISDIGASWPADYVALAEKLGITDGLEINSTANVTRGDAAIMLTNLLNAKTDKGSGNTLGATAFENSIENVHIISNPGANTDEISYIADGSSEPIIVKHSMDTIPYGSYGTLILNSNDVALGFIDAGISKQVVVQKAEISQITTDEGIFKLSSPTNVTLIVEGEVSTYADLFLEIYQGTQITINTDLSDKIVSIVADNTSHSSQTFLYKTYNSIPSGYTIYKNGSVILASDINTNDVITIDSQNSRAYVSSTQISGIYQDASPSIFYPDQVTILGGTYNVLTDAKSLFAGQTTNKPITIYLDYAGNVAHMEATAQNEIAYLDSYDGTTCTFILENGKTVEVEVDESASGTTSILGTRISNIVKNIGKLVELKFTSSGNIVVNDFDELETTKSNFYVTTGQIGDYTVSPNVEIYDALDSDSPYVKIESEDLTVSSIPSSRILGMTVENNIVTRIILKNVTGNSLDYGFLSYTSEAPSSSGSDDDDSGSVKYNKYSLTIAKNTILEYTPINDKNYTLTPVAISKHLDGRAYPNYISVTTLSKVGTVNQDAFLGSKFVTSGSDEYAVSEEVIVYDTNSRTFLTLAEARQNYDSFTLYKDNSYQNSSVRIITVK